MFNYTLGEELFRKGVQKLVDDKTPKEKVERNMRRFYANDIFKRLDEVVQETNYSLPTGLSINSIAAPWINRDRVPLVTVVRDYDTGNITFMQVNFTQVTSNLLFDWDKNTTVVDVFARSRNHSYETFYQKNKNVRLNTEWILYFQSVYLRESAPPSNEKMHYQWDIPIVMVTEKKLDFSQHKPYIWMTKESPYVSVEKEAFVDPKEFIIVNPEEIGEILLFYCLLKILKIWTAVDFLKGALAKDSLVIN